MGFQDPSVPRRWFLRNPEEPEVRPVEPHSQADANRVRRLERQNAAWVRLFRQAQALGAVEGDALRSITRLATQALEVEEAGVWLHDEGRRLLTAIDHYRLPADRHTDGQWVRLHEPDAERMPWKAEGALALEDVASDPRAGVIAGIWTHPPRVTAALLAAVRRGGRVIGLIAFGHVGSRRAWHTDEIEFARAVADFTAMALEGEERHRAARELEQAFEFQQQIIETAATAVYLTDAEGRIQDVNEAFCAATDYLPEEIRGQSGLILDADPDPESPASGCSTSAPASVERTFRQRCRLQGKAGRRLEVIRNVSMIRGADGRVRGRLVSFADVTRIVEVQRRLESALAEAENARRDAVAANEAKSRFLANMSHEIRTPMNAILGMTDLVLEDSIAPQQREKLEMVQASAESLLGLLNDILDLAKIEAGRTELEPIEFGLRATVADALQSIAQRAAQKGLDFRWSVDPALPETLVGDAMRIRQVLLNLAENAVKFTEHGSVEVRLEAEAGEENVVWLRTTVTDTGIGIGADRLGAIFEAFTQADGSTTRKYGGTGLGTTIARQLVERMGGRLWAESILGAGSTFHFTVPLARSGDARPPRTDPRPDGVVGGRTVLVADGDDASRTLLTRMLERKGWHVRRASDGRGALQALSEESCDVAVIDLRLGNPDGLETIRSIRAGEGDAGARIPLVVLASDAEAAERMSLAELGIQALVAKPIDRQHLLRALERAWAARTAQRLAA